MRFVLAMLLSASIASIAGCGDFDSFGAETAGAPDGRDDGEGGGAGEPPSPGDAESICSFDSDCQLAASSCCECPSFAVNGGGFGVGECEEVECGNSDEVCPAVEARCDAGRCVATCAPVLAEQSCENGFARDAFGCLLNECAGGSDGLGACTFDSDCAQVPADCCGCARGGKDRAVLADSAQAAIDALNCPNNPTCPEVDTCDSAKEPRCVAGQCVLSETANEAESESLCGTPELGSCAPGQVCMLNLISSSEAGDLGLGVCAPEAG